MTRITSLCIAERWPDRPERMTEDELAAFRAGRVDGRIFVSDDLPHAAAWRTRRGTSESAAYHHEMSIAFPVFRLALAVRGLSPESFRERFGVLWEWRDCASKLFRLDGVEVPVFLASCNVMDVDDWRSVSVTRAGEAREGGGHEPRTG